MVSIGARKSCGRTWRHIPQKIDADDVNVAIDRLERRVRELEAENARLKSPAR